MKRSSEPKIARCSITGVCLLPSSPMYVAPRRPGMLRSTCNVPHCQSRPIASRSTNSIFGP